MVKARILTNSIESAQMKVEARNFGIRKSVLQFDDVMNRQREIIYSQRAKVLDGEDLSSAVRTMVVFLGVGAQVHAPLQLLHVVDMLHPFGVYHPQQDHKREPGKVARNDPCPCGSGKKYKKCCGRQS